VSSYGDKIQEFNRRIADIASELASLLAKRKEYAFAAAEGDERAKKQIVDTDFQSDALRKEEMTLHCAVETALALERQHEQEAKASEEHSRQVEAYNAARGVVTLNEELDLALTHLREMFEGRAILLRSLGNTATVDPTLLMRLSNKSGPTSACHHAGLGKFVHLDMVPVTSQLKLATSNELLLKIGEPPSKPNGKGKVH
jgi:hypothetical protein